MLVVFRLNSPAIVYRTTRKVIPTFENINAVKARQWSFARSNGGFCLRRTDRLRSILLPFPTRYTLDAFKLSSFVFLSLQTQNWTWYPLKYYFFMYSTHPRQKSRRGWWNWNWPHSLSRLLSAHFILVLILL